MMVRSVRDYRNPHLLEDLLDCTGSVVSMCVCVNGHWRTSFRVGSLNITQLKTMGTL